MVDIVYRTLYSSIGDTSLMKSVTFKDFTLEQVVSFVKRQRNNKTKGLT